ncbi:LuxR C-terminal-related transcriptional regulator [Acinetobacter gerneri]|uniref:LuxR C-terminal-related transcriptional regulator n=1 Tax=Acinetobacter gerneri TaxID=202952 RepID=UPI003AF6B3AC
MGQIQQSGVIVRPLSRGSLNDLTDREAQTLMLIASGLSNKQIGRELDISDGTVKVYVRNMLRKFNLNSRLELASWVYQNLNGETGSVSLEISEVPGRISSALELLDELPGLIYRGLNDREWYMEYVSAGCLQLTGYPAGYLTSRRNSGYGSLILDEYGDYVWYCVQCALLKQEAYRLNYKIRCADGSVKEVWEKGVGIYSSSGEILGVEGAIFEV